MEITDEKATSNESIKVFLRIRPNLKHQNLITLNQDKNLVEFFIPKDEEKGLINNSKERFLFKFNQLFPINTKQNQIFDNVAKEVIDSALDGYNGTIFAYGQTGSGKTYTITGGAERVEDRGIIPRTITYIFNETKKRSDCKWTISVSYLEIYNNEGFDLLYEGRETKQLEDLPKIILRENQQKQLVLKNLGLHRVDNEEEALYMLMIGDDNRIVAETPKNDASTRSHCIFIIMIESQKIGEDVKTVSKLHIVDLSGSEKAYKTNMNGIRMEEAKNINLSLHFLESVIVSINQKENHIPYRNSMMTMVLRDSLGGNCKTRMIATISADSQDVYESISTCRFAQRVSLIKNTAIRNEIEEPIIVIQRQKNEIENLKRELEMLKGESICLYLFFFIDQKTVLDEDDINECKKIAKEYLKNDDFSYKIEIRDYLMLQEIFTQIKIIYKNLELIHNNCNNNSSSTMIESANNKGSELFEITNKKLIEENRNLKEIIKTRDEEIRALLSSTEKSNEIIANRTLLKRIQDEDDEKNKNQINTIKNRIFGEVVTFDNAILKNSINNNLNYSKTNQNTKLLNESQISSKSLNDTTTANKSSMNLSLLKEINTANSYLTSEIQISESLLSNKKNCYELFKQNYIKKHIRDGNLKELNDKHSLGQTIAKELKELRSESNSIKTKIENIRREKIIHNINDDDPNNKLKLIEDDLFNNYNKIKQKMKSDQEKLNQLYQELNLIQSTIQTNEIQMNKHFEFWYNTMCKKLDNDQNSTTLSKQINNTSSSQYTNNNALESNLDITSTNSKKTIDKYNETKNRILMN